MSFLNSSCPTHPLSALHIVLHVSWAKIKFGNLWTFRQNSKIKMFGIEILNISIIKLWEFCPKGQRSLSFIFSFSEKRKLLTDLNQWVYVVVKVENSSNILTFKRSGDQKIITFLCNVTQFGFSWHFNVPNLAQPLSFKVMSYILEGKTAVPVHLSTAFFPVPVAGVFFVSILGWKLFSWQGNIY